MTWRSPRRRRSTHIILYQIINLSTFLPFTLFVTRLCWKGASLTICPSVCTLQLSPRWQPTRDFTAGSVKHINLSTNASCCCTVTDCVNVHTPVPRAPNGHTVSEQDNEGFLHQLCWYRTQQTGSLSTYPLQGNNQHRPSEENTGRSSLYLSRYLMAELNKQLH